MSSHRAPRLGEIRVVQAGTRVGRLEVFFDLVFVYAFYTVARFVTRELTVLDLAQGGLVFAMLWVCWISHVLVAQRVRLAEGYAPLVVFAAMATVSAMALTIPHAFGEQAGIAPGPLLFPACYLVVRGLHLGLHWQAAAGLAGERRQLARLAAAALAATAVLFLAGILPWFFGAFAATPARMGMWALAVLIEYAAGMVIGLSGWRLAAPGQFAERFELIFILALGESIISIGIGSGVIGRPITWPAFFSSIIAITVLAMLWWTYFDLLAPAAELVMHDSQGHARIALARDAYIYLHLPIIAGLMALALAGEEMLRFLGSATVDIVQPAHGLGQPLLFGGLAVYLLGIVLFQVRTLGTVLWTRVAALALSAALVPAAGRLSSAAVLGLLAAICIGLVTVEIHVFAESRQALHATMRQEREAHAARETEWRRRHR